MVTVSFFDPAFIKDHNQEAQAVWSAFHAGKPIRASVYLGTATQFFIFNDDLNPGEIVDFETYCTDAATMLDFQLRSAVWRGEKIALYCDDPIGLSEAFEVRIDLQNFNEVAYFGAVVEFISHQVPDTRPILAGEHKNAIFDAGLRDGSPDNVVAEPRLILESDVLEGGKFVLREGNNLTPRSPFENLEAMYQTARSFA